MKEALKDRQFVMWREQLCDSLAIWQTNKGSESLLNGQQLLEAKQWLKVNKDQLNSQEIGYINKSAWQPKLNIAKIAIAAFLPLVLVSWFFSWSANKFSSPTVGIYILLAKSGIYTLQPTMIQIPCKKEGCKFIMGSADSNQEDEKPAHEVVINNDYKISQYEITFEQYAVFAYLISSDGGCKNNDVEGKPHIIKKQLNDAGWGKGQRPVINVSWNDARCYALWLDNNYRLPTEAEWEYAARAGTESDYYWGDEEDPDNYAWYYKNSNGKTHPVGQKKSNAFGLYDMSGNVREWVQDCYAQNYKLAPKNGTAWEEGAPTCSRVLRGGSWSNETLFIRSAYRYRFTPDYRLYFIGFRLAQD